VPQSLTYLSAFSVLEEGGLEALTTLLRQELKRFGATLLIIDGLVAVEEAAPSEQDFKKFIHELQVINGFMGCTTLLLTTGQGRGLKAEHTMVDGLFVLRERATGVRAVRELTVRKFRGSAHMRGNHAFEITEDGLTIYPRLEELVARGEPPAPLSRRRHSFGIKGLDEMLEGGLPEASPTMLLGSPGSGKTLLGLHFVAEGARNGERSHYYSFYDIPSRAVEQAACVGLDLQPLLASGLLELSFRPPTEQILDKLGNELVTLIRETGVRRLFLDGFDGLSKAAVHKRRSARFMAALVNECRAHGVSLVYTVETRSLFGPELRFVARGVSMLTENILFTRNTELNSELNLFVSILKLRNSGHDRAMRRLHISSRGLRVDGPFEDAEQLASGMATMPARKAAKRKLLAKRRSR
jgi:circadian clock protein KaiC